MTDISAAISAVAPHADNVLWTTALSPFMAAGGITTPRRVAAFIGQVAWESTQFSSLEENMNYSADRLCEVWPSRFSAQMADAFAHQPEHIADMVYENRMGNGGYDSGDGWKFRGAGLIQLTGRDMHTRFAAAAKIPVDTIGDYLRTPKGAAQSAVWFWQSKGLNRLADQWLLRQMTQVINGGTDGLAQRISFCNTALKALGTPAPDPVRDTSSDDLNAAELTSLQPQE